MERKITIEETAVYHEDYQMRMLQMNEIEGLLPVKGRGIDGASYYDYNVSGKISMQAMYERNKISGEDLKLFLKQLLAVIRETEKYLLNIHCILLEPEYIFYEDGRFFFCYYPQARQDVWEKIHKLTEYFVKRADYEDKESVRIVFILHKETMAENYSLEKITKECIPSGASRYGHSANSQGIPSGEKETSAEEEDGIRVQKLYDEDDKDMKYEFEGQRGRTSGMDETEYDSMHHDWIRRQHRGSLIMEETENMWTPMKRFLNRRKKPKWGDWDGLYIEEEEL